MDATCRAVGNYCYVFVSDDQWGSRVSQADVVGLLQAFELRTPADHSKGIFPRTVEAFGEPPDVNGDPKVYVPLLDIRDGFEEDGKYIGGYFSGVNSTSDRTSVLIVLPPSSTAGPKRATVRSPIIVKRELWKGQSHSPDQDLSIGNFFPASSNISTL